MARRRKAPQHQRLAGYRQAFRHDLDRGGQSRAPLARRAQGGARRNPRSSCDRAPSSGLRRSHQTVAWVMEGDKTYRFTVRWGEARDSDDAEGEVIAESDARPTREDRGGAAPIRWGDRAGPANLLGDQDRWATRFYDLAREGEEIELKPRLIRIDSFPNWSKCRIAITRSLKSRAARAPICAALHAIWGRPLAATGTSRSFVVWRSGLYGRGRNFAGQSRAR